LNLVDPEPSQKAAGYAGAKLESKSFGAGFLQFKVTN
jgi:hypothetical protein